MHCMIFLDVCGGEGVSRKFFFSPSPFFIFLLSLHNLWLKSEKRNLKKTTFENTVLVYGKITQLFLKIDALLSQLCNFYRLLI